MNELEMFQSKKINTGIFISMLCWLIGFGYAFNWNILNKINQNKTVISIDSKSFIITLINFQNILIANLTVAIILAFLGYLSFGLISIFGSLHNGFILAIHLNGFFEKFNFNSLYKVMLHAPTEFLALCYFGAIGILGFNNLKYVFKNEQFNFFDSLPSFKFFIFPTGLLILSALIESDIFLILLAK